MKPLSIPPKKLFANIPRQNITTQNFAIKALSLAAFATLGISPANATLYWDTNGTSAGGGTTPTGAWGTNAFWNTDSTGGSGGAFQTATTSNDDLVFVSGSTASGAYSVSISGTQSAKSITLNSGALTLGTAGSTIALGSGGISIPAGALTLTINSNIAMGANETFNDVASTSSITISGTISGNFNITLNGNGTKTFSAANNYTGTTTLSGASILTLSGSNGSVGSGDVILNTVSASIKFANTVDKTVSNNITGQGSSGGLTQASATILTLTGTNTYTGGTLIRLGGTIKVASISTNLGGGTIKLGNGSEDGTLLYSGTGETVTKLVRLNGTTGDGTIQNDGSGALIFMGGISTLNDGSKILHLQGSNTGNNQIQGAISDSASATRLTKAGTGNWILSGANTYTGKTTISNGMLQFSKTTALYNDTTASWTAANITAASGATLALNVGGTNEFAASDINTLLANISATTSSTTGLQAGAKIGFDTTNASGGIFTQGNAIANSTGTGGGAIGVTKLGTNTLVFDKSNTYTGGTTVNGGTLIVNGSITSAVTVNNAATLGGSGTVGAITVSAGGTLAPGNSPGLMTAPSASFNGAGSTYAAQIDISNSVSSGATTTSGAPDAYHYDSTALTATSGSPLSLDANNSVLSLSILNNGVATTSAALNSLGKGSDSNQYNPGGTNSTLDNYFIFTLADGATAAGGAANEFKYVNFGGSNIAINYGVTSYFGADGAALNANLGTFVADDGQLWAISYNGDAATNSTFSATGNDVVITAIPEPGTWAMLLGGIGIMGVWQRRRDRMAR